MRRKVKQLRNLIKAIIELIQYAQTIRIDPKLNGIIARIKINIESITGESID